METTEILKRVSVGIFGCWGIIYGLYYAFYYGVFWGLIQKEIVIRPDIYKGHGPTTFAVFSILLGAYLALGGVFMIWLAFSDNLI